MQIAEHSTNNAEKSPVRRRRHSVRQQTACKSHTRDTVMRGNDAPTPSKNNASLPREGTMSAEAALFALLGTEEVHRCMLSQAPRGDRSRVLQALSTCRRLWRGGRVDDDDGAGEGGELPRLRDVVDCLDVPHPTTITYIGAEEWRLRHAAEEGGGDSTAHVMLSLCRANIERGGSLLDAASASMGGVVQLEADVGEAPAAIRESMVTVVSWGHRLRSFPEVVLVETPEAPSFVELPEQLDSRVLLKEEGRVVDSTEACTYVLCAAVVRLEEVGWCAAQRERPAARRQPWRLFSHQPCACVVHRVASLPDEAQVRVAAYVKRQPASPQGGTTMGLLLPLASLAGATVAPRLLSTEALLPWAEAVLLLGVLCTGVLSRLQVATAGILFYGVYLPLQGAGPAQWPAVVLMGVALGVSSLLLSWQKRPCRRGGDAVPSCVVCLDREVTHLMLPCRHACLCGDCVDDIGGKCPVCRCRLDSIERIYL